MKVYVVTSGKHSGYDIEAEFTDKEKAELYATAHRCEIEEYDADEIKVNSKNLYNNYTICLSDKLKVISFQVYIVGGYKGKSVLPFNYGMSVCFTTKRNLSNEQAIKIARDHVYQYRMEQIKNEIAEISKLFDSVKDDVNNET